jgi:hypothetical protein
MSQGAALAVMEEQFSEKASEILDEIFSPGTDIRNSTTLLSPRHCHDREILLSVSYTENETVGKVINRILAWAKNGNIDKLRGLMLY